MCPHGYHHSGYVLYRYILYLSLGLKLITSKIIKLLILKQQCL